MNLLPEELRKTLPPLYSQEGSSAPVTCRARPLVPAVSYRRRASSRAATRRGW
jgi:hypothetical protein